MMMKTPTPAWNVASAKARFSEMLERARTQGPQTITRNGRDTAVVVSVEEWERRTKPRVPLGDFLANSPLRGSGLDLERPIAPPRTIDL